MVKLQVVEDRNMGGVVDEFTALVEEGAIVFVTLNDERIAQRAEMASGRRILRNSTDKVAGITPALPKKKRGYGRRGRLSVGAGNNNIPPLEKDLVVEHRRERGEGERPRIKK